MQQILAVPREKLLEANKVKVNILPDVESLYQHFARNMADEIKQNNAQGKPTEDDFVGRPYSSTSYFSRGLKQGKNKLEKCLYLINMDEYLDWQGRPVSLNHPMSFERFMRKDLFDLLDEETSIPENHMNFLNIPFALMRLVGKLK